MYDVKTPSTTEISNSWELWNEYVNPGGHMSRGEFDELSVPERNLLQKEYFPDECDDIDSEGNPIEE